MIDWSQMITADEVELSIRQQQREAEKNEKQRLIDEITVEVDGFIFDGNEKSQARMALVANAISDSELVLWVLHNNSIESITGWQLREAVRLSAMKMSNIWIGDHK